MPPTAVKSCSHAFLKRGKNISDKDYKDLTLAEIPLNVKGVLNNRCNLLLCLIAFLRSKL